jgi:DNA-binding transcriptional regulator YhcF (GntR family)/uncharacterized small protein (DUF1192 family)
MERESQSAAVADLELSIDRDAEVPIGLQLAWGLRARIYDGTLESGHRLPGLREVAEATGVNINTVRAVYQRLNQEGLIDSQQGSGTFVATRPPSLSSVAMIASSAAQEAHETGVDPREVATAIYVAADAQAQPGNADARRRRRLREQIATLERTVVDIEAKHPGVAPPARKTRRGIGPILLDTAELERVRTAMVRRLASVQAAIDRLEAEASTKQQSQPASARKGTTRGRRRVRPAPAGA